MILRPPRYTRPDTLFPNTTLFRSRLEADIVDRDHGGLALALAGEGLAEVFGCDHGLDRGLGSGDWRLGCRADAARTWLNWTLGAGAFRSEERRVGKGWVSPLRSWVSAEY